MIRIAITAAAFDVVASTLPLGSIAYEPQLTADGGRFIWIDRRARTQLDALRRPGEDYSGVILRLAAMEASRPGKRRSVTPKQR
jgi:hypothetical protein